MSLHYSRAFQGHFFAQSAPMDCVVALAKSRKREMSSGSCPIMRVKVITPLDGAVS